MSYSLRAVVTDGPVTAPRWVHHVIKVATHATVAFALTAATHRIVLASILAGPVLWWLLAVHEWIIPTDPTPHSDWEHIADWMTDSALSAVPLAGALASTGDWVGAGLLLGAVATLWKVGHQDARP